MTGAGEAGRFIGFGEGAGAAQASRGRRERADVPASFIVLEGGEGAGKSLLAARLARRLEAAGIHTIEVREPGGTPAGEAARELLGKRLTPWGEAFAFLLARSELVSRVIKPALEGGAVVLCDRFRASTVAYQGYGRGLDLKRLAEANASAAQGLTPDLTLYLDLPPETGLQRKYKSVQPSLTLPDVPPELVVKASKADIEGPAVGREELAFHERVREGYRQQLAQAPEGTWLAIDATQPPEAVEAEAWAAVAALLRLPADG